MPRNINVTPIELLASIPTMVAGQTAIVLTVRLRDDLASLLESEQPIWS